MERNEKQQILKNLKQEIMHLQGYKPGSQQRNNSAFEVMKECFPNQTFPTAAVHEFMPSSSSSLGATMGFISAILSSFLQDKGVAIWIGKYLTTFPPALTSFGLAPEQIIFINTVNEKHLLWTTEEALKCSAVSAVVGEISDLSFIASRRLQLAVEKSQVTGLILRTKPESKQTTASVSRWRITSMPSESEEPMPGIGFPSWKVELVKMRNGMPGQWSLKWIDQQFVLAAREMSMETVQAKRNVG